MAEERVRAFPLLYKMKGPSYQKRKRRHFLISLGLEVLNKEKFKWEISESEAKPTVAVLLVYR